MGFLALELYLWSPTVRNNAGFLAEQPLSYIQNYFDWELRRMNVASAKIKRSRRSVKHRFEICWWRWSLWCNTQWNHRPSRGRIPSSEYNKLFGSQNVSCFAKELHLGSLEAVLALYLQVLLVKWQLAKSLLWRNTKTTIHLNLPTAETCF